MVTAVYLQLYISSTALQLVGELPLVGLAAGVRCGGPLRTQLGLSSGEDDPGRVGGVLAEAVVGDGEHGGPLPWSYPPKRRGS